MRKRTNSSKAGRWETQEKEQETEKQRKNSTEKETKERIYRFPNFVTLLRDTSLNVLVTAQLSAITIFLR
jgi:hypothetical protein